MPFNFFIGTVALLYRIEFVRTYAVELSATYSPKYFAWIVWSSFAFKLNNTIGMRIWFLEVKIKSGSGGIRTRASEETGA